MQLIPLSCNKCGAAIELPQDARFATCSHCGARLAVERTGDAAYTRVLDEVKSVRSGLDRIQRQNDLERLDREWEVERKKHLGRDKSGNTYEPSAVVSILAGFLVAAAGVVWTVMASRDGLDLFSALGLLLVPAGIGIAIYGYSSAQVYGSKKKDYEARRSRLTREIDRD